MELNIKDVTIKKLDGDGYFFLLAMWNGVHVGKVDCTLHPEKLMIGDLKVEEQCRPKWPVCDTLLNWFCIRRQWVCCRRKGIGDLLLRRVFAEAEAAQIGYIYGCVTEWDFDRSPFLLDWYRRHGFVVSEPDDECKSCRNAYKKITRQISPPVQSLQK